MEEFFSPLQHHQFIHIQSSSTQDHQLATMNNLSTELLTMIIGYLDEPPEPSFDTFATPPRWLKSMSRCKPSLARYSTVCRKWQEIVESRTMASIEIFSDELPSFAFVFWNPRRRVNLRQLDYTIVLPEMSKTRREHSANCSAFEKAAYDLFNLLSAWETKDGASFGPISLYLAAAWKKNTALTQGHQHSHFDMFWPKAAHRFLKFSPHPNGLYPTPLPALKSVAALNVWSCGA